MITIHTFKFNKLNQAHYFILGLVCFFLFGCDEFKKPDSYQKSNFTEFIFSNTLVISSKEWFVSSDKNLYLKDFNVEKYIKADSIIFTCPLRSEGESEICLAELYNITDKQAIPESTISYSGLQMKSINSSNIKNYLPLKSITLAVRLKSLNGNFVMVGFASLRIHQK